MILNPKDGLLIDPLWETKTYAKKCNNRNWHKKRLMDISYTGNSFWGGAAQMHRVVPNGQEPHLLYPFGLPPCRPNTIGWSFHSIPLWQVSGPIAVHWQGQVYNEVSE